MESDHRIRPVLEQVSNIVYLNVFTLEEIAENNLDNIYFYPSMGKSYPNLRQHYMDALLKTNDLSLYLKDSKYLSLGQKYENSDICASFYAPLGQEDCKNTSKLSLVNKFNRL